MMTRHFVESVIRHGWQPYIKEYWLDFARQRGGVIITFKDHEDHQYKCSNKTANEILTLSSSTRVK